MLVTSASFWRCCIAAKKERFRAVQSKNLSSSRIMLAQAEGPFLAESNLMIQQSLTAIRL